MRKTLRSAALKTLGNNIRMFRLDLNLSQEMLAEKAGTTRCQICRIENGKNEFGVLLLCNIARALQVSIDTLIRGVSP